MAKRTGRVGSIKFVGQMGRGSKWVIFKWVNRIAGENGSAVESRRVLSRVASQVELTCIFQTICIFF